MSFIFTFTQIPVNPYAQLRLNVTVGFQDDGVVISAAFLADIFNFQLIAGAIGIWHFIQLNFDVLPGLGFGINNFERIFLFGNYRNRGFDGVTDLTPQADVLRSNRGKILHLPGDDEVLLRTGCVVRVDIRRFLQGSAAVSFGVDA